MPSDDNFDLSDYLNEVGAIGPTEEESFLMLFEATFEGALDKLPEGFEKNFRIIEDLKSDFEAAQNHDQKKNVVDAAMNAIEALAQSVHDEKPEASTLFTTLALGPEDNIQKELAKTLDDVTPYIDQSLNLAEKFFQPRTELKDKRPEKFISEDDEKVAILIVTEMFLSPGAVLSGVSNDEKRHALQDRALRLLMNTFDHAVLCEAEHSYEDGKAVYYGPLVEAARENPDVAARISTIIEQENFDDAHKALRLIAEAQPAYQDSAKPFKM